MIQNHIPCGFVSTIHLKNNDEYIQFYAVAKIQCH